MGARGSDYASSRRLAAKMVTAASKIKHATVAVVDSVAPVFGRRLPVNGMRTDSVAGAAGVAGTSATGAGTSVTTSDVVGCTGTSFLGSSALGVGTIGSRTAGFAVTGT